MTITRKIGISEITPSELASEFCEMDACGQAEFFNCVAVESDKWVKPFCFQLQEIVNSRGLTRDGRFIMQQIGDYAERMV